MKQASQSQKFSNFESPETSFWRIELKGKWVREKLRAYGVRGKSGDWFESYLTNRKQFCSLNGLHSTARKVSCGIPQGSCLGPLLFIIYLNDLEECLQSSRASIYADDTILTIASNPVKSVDDTMYTVNYSIS